MKKFCLFFMLVTIGIILTSCYKLFFKSYGILDYSASPRIISGQDKKVIFIPMHHIGKKEFYDDVKKRIDSLRNDGFVIYYEGTKYSRHNDSLQNDTLRMKFRKILGIDLRTIQSNGGYIDTANNTLVGLKVKALSKYKLINQPKYDIIDTSLDKRADVYLSDAMAAFEQKYGTVVLNDCDFKTPSEEKYVCGTYNLSVARKFIVLDYRDNNIAKEIINDTHAKIAVVYGSKHFQGILEALQKKDPAWKAD